MSVDTKLKELIINTLSPEQLPEQPSETEIYLVEDDAEYATVEELARKQDKLIAGTGISIDENNVISASGAVESVNGKTGTVVLTGEDIAADVSELTDTVQGHLQTLHDKVQDIELFKFPNATIIGEPTIQNGQVSGFSVDNYLQFPFILDLHNQPFVIDFCFTTGDDVTTQQNILDSQFGLALAISNGKGLMAISHNGTSWAGAVTGTMDINPNTTYYARLSWNRINYQTQLSTDGITYTPDMNFGSTQSPYPRTMFIGGCSGSAIGHSPHPFKGTINMNYAYLTVAGNVIWQGMDDAGLSTRADVSLDNLDQFGQAKFDAKQNKLIAGENITIDEETNTISAAGGDGLPDQTGNNGKFLTTDGTNASWSDKPLTNKSTRANSVQIASDLASTGDYQAIVGVKANGTDHYAIAMGYQAHAGYGGIGIGYTANASATHSIQIGTGTNSETKTLKIGFDWNANYKLLNSNGIIPDERLAAKPGENGRYVLSLNKISDTSSSVSWVKDQSDDSNLVHKTGDETIGGVKTFTENIGLMAGKQIIDSNLSKTVLGLESSSNTFLVGTQEYAMSLRGSETRPLYTNSSDSKYLALKDDVDKKQDVISDLGTIRSDASAGASAATTIAGYGDIVTHNASEFATPGDIPTVPTNVSAFTNDSGYITSAYHDSSKQDTISNLSSIIANANAGASAASTIANYGDVVSHNASEFQPAGSYVTTSKLQVVDALPANPDANTFYFVKE